MAVLHPGPPRRKITTYGWSTRADPIVAATAIQQARPRRRRVKSIRRADQARDRLARGVYGLQRYGLFERDDWSNALRDTKPGFLGLPNR